MVVVVFLGFFLLKRGGSVTEEIKISLGIFLTGDAYGCHKHPGMPVHRTALGQHCSVAFIQITFSKRLLWTLDHP